MPRYHILSCVKCLQSPLPFVMLFPGLGLSSSPPPFFLVCTAPISLLCGGRGVQECRQLKAKPGKDQHSHALALALLKHLEAFKH